MNENSAWRGSLRKVLPTGAAIPDDTWRRRHGAVLVLLWAHLPILVVHGHLRGISGPHLTGETAAIAAAALAASMGRLQRSTRMLAATGGLLFSSAALLHLPGGPVVMRLHVLVVVAVITLYQSWLPLLLALGFVALPRGVAGALDPVATLRHPAALASSWVWAAIHALVILAESAACLSTWRLNETATARAVQAVEAEQLTAQFLAITRAQKGALEHQSLHDSLTGLPNRTLLNERLETVIRQGRRDLTPVGGVGDQRAQHLVVQCMAGAVADEAPL
ncbi:MAG: hypothetical protein NVSMB32_07520 [Actinomycetota bacterium]